MGQQSGKWADPELRAESIGRPERRSRRLCCTQSQRQRQKGPGDEVAWEREKSAMMQLSRWRGVIGLWQEKRQRQVGQLGERRQWRTASGRVGTGPGRAHCRQALPAAVGCALEVPSPYCTYEYLDLLQYSTCVHARYCLPLEALQTHGGARLGRAKTGHRQGTDRAPDGWRPARGGTRS